ncbi:uncharacterized protein [Panulirus ornatus]|uniref:uncharacterized protein n=1 Tax=Panulirus ornatus TaxID=150431 RepID=UPI003A89E903
MNSDNDYSDYEDKETVPRYQVFPSQVDELVQGMYCRMNNISDEDGKRNNLSVREKTFEGIRNGNKDVIEHHSGGREIITQDLDQYKSNSGCERMQLNIKSTETFLTQCQNACFSSVPTDSAVVTSRSRYSQLLSIMKGRSCLQNTNGIQGDNCFQNKNSIQGESHPYDVEHSREQKWSQAVNAPSTREEPPGHNAPEFWSCTGDNVNYSSELFRNEDRDVGSCPRSCVDDYSHQMTHDADACNDRGELLSPLECPFGKLFGKRTEVRLNDKKVLPFCTPQCSNTQKDLMLKESLDSREQGLHDFGTASSPDECNIPIDVKNTLIKKVKEQLNDFYWKVKVNTHAHILSTAAVKERELFSKLEIHLNQIRLTTSLTDIDQKLSALSCALQTDVLFASFFLNNFIDYLLSVFDKEKNLTRVSEILEYFIPCVRTVISGRVGEKVINNIRNEKLLQVLYNTLVKIFRRESKYRVTDTEDLMKYQSGSKVIKAHIVRMSPEDSQKLFQETFADTGNLSDLYLIYTWQIFKIFEIEEGYMSEMMEESGKFISIVPAKDLKDKEWKVPFSPLGSKCLESEPSNKYKETPHPVVYLSFEWTDFRVGHLYENGVAFLVNVTDWAYHLHELSLSIEKLEVKRKVKFIPSMGSSYALTLQHGVYLPKGKEDIRYIRVRVVRLVGPMARVYGIDTGSIHVCEAADLILLPARILNCTPCGRLARLPVIPAPNPALLTPSLALLVAFSQRADLAQELCNIDIRPLASWIQVKGLTQLTLDLLEAIVEAIPKTHLLPDICSIVTDYLLRITLKQTQEPAYTRTAFSILLSAMQSSPEIRLFLAKEGAFITLCDMGLRLGEEQAWDVVRTLLGGSKAMEKWIYLSWKVSRIHRKRTSNNWESQTHQVLPSSTSLNVDTSPSVMYIASMVCYDSNWDLEVRNTIRSRQLIHYQSHGGWKWERGQILASDVGKLHYHHMFDLQNDKTHHIILDKSVPNIRRNTLLQIILGMLNTGLGGRIYIGLNQSGIIYGVKINQNQRDCFMLGFSTLVTSEIKPMLLPCDSLIQFIPVIHPGTLSPMSKASATSTPHSSESDFFVIILTVRPQPGLVYHSRNDPEIIFLREGGVTSIMRGQHLAQFITSSANAHQELQNQVSLEKQAMINLISSTESQCS